MVHVYRKSDVSFNYGKRKEEKRKSPKTLEFKRQINSFLEDKNPEIIYAIKRDLELKADKELIAYKLDVMMEDITEIKQLLKERK